MNVDDVIDRLTKAQAPERKFDGDIAEVAGWKRVVERVVDTQGKNSSKTTWYPPNSGNMGRVPEYTTNLQLAYELFEQLCPNQNAGIAWGDGYASAQVLDGPLVERAATPPMALCILALKAHGARIAGRETEYRE
jgi:hypothetical protein